MSADLPLRIEGLAFRYHARPEWVLRDVSLTLEPGELLLVAGASGCGKTTLIAFSGVWLVGSTLIRALLRVGDFWVPDAVLRLFGF